MFLSCHDFSDAFHRRIPFLTMYGLAAIKHPSSFDAERSERFRRLPHYPPAFPDLTCLCDLGKSAMSLIFWTDPFLNGKASLFQYVML